MCRGITSQDSNRFINLHNFSISLPIFWSDMLKPSATLFFAVLPFFRSC
jgi:hypothetical protein